MLEPQRMSELQRLPSVFDAFATWPDSDTSSPRPFVVGEHVYCSDGRGAVRMKFDVVQHGEMPTLDPKRKLSTVHMFFTRYVPAGVEPFQIDAMPAPPFPKRERCQACRIRTSSPEPCEDCGGVGSVWTVPWRAVYLTKHDVWLGETYARALFTWRAVICATHEPRRSRRRATTSTNPLYFQIDGGVSGLVEGLLMPIEPTGRAGRSDNLILP